jgi:hypothetical protein
MYGELLAVSDGGKDLGVAIEHEPNRSAFASSGVSAFGGTPQLAP